MAADFWTSNHRVSLLDATQVRLEVAGSAHPWSSVTSAAASMLQTLAQHNFIKVTIAHETHESNQALSQAVQVTAVVATPSTS
jgi:hypothetical protein